MHVCFMLVCMYVPKLVFLYVRDPSANVAATQDPILLGGGIAKNSVTLKGEYLRKFQVIL
jgi:hypothetical protein